MSERKITVYIIERTNQPVGVIPAYNRTMIFLPADERDLLTNLARSYPNPITLSNLSKNYTYLKRLKTKGLCVKSHGNSLYSLNPAQVVMC